MAGCSECTRLATQASNILGGLADFSFGPDADVVFTEYKADGTTVTHTVASIAKMIRLLQAGDPNSTFKVAAAVDGDDAVNLTQLQDMLQTIVDSHTQDIKDATGLVAYDRITYNGVGDTDHIITVPPKGKYLLEMTLTKNRDNFPNCDDATFNLLYPYYDASITNPNITNVHGGGAYIYRANTDNAERSAASQYLENDTTSPQNINLKLITQTPLTSVFGGAVEYRLIKIGDL